MEWTIETPAWDMTFKLKDITLIEDLKFAASGQASYLGVPKLDIDPNTETKAIIETEAFWLLFKKTQPEDYANFEKALKAE